MASRRRNPRVPQVGTKELVRRRPEVVVVDAHGPSYFALSHLPGAVNIPPHEVPRLAPTRVGDPAVPVVVYGSRGSSNAEIVADQLLRLGYRDVSVYEDGLQGWIEAGLPVETDDPSSATDPGRA